MMAGRVVPQPMLRAPAGGQGRRAQMLTVGAVAVAAAWTAMVGALEAGRIALPHATAVTLAFPLIAAASLAALHPVPSRTARTAVAWMLLAAAALAGARTAAAHPTAVLAAPAGALVALALSRRPSVAVLALLGLTAAFGSLAAYTPLSAGPVVTLLLAGLGVGLAWNALVRGRPLAAPLSPGTACLLAAAAVGVAQVLASDPLRPAAQSFRSNGFLLLAVPLLALAPWPAGQLRRAAHGVVVIGLLVAAYAVLRLVTGPTAQEHALALQQPYNVNEGALRLIGSMFSRHQLSAWLGTVLPFCAGLAAVAGVRTRIAVVAAAVLGVVAIAGTHARSGALGLAVGLAVLLVVLNVAHALPRVRLSAAVLSIALAALVGYAAVSVSTGSGQGGASRYTVILAPGRDTAYQARQLKWREAIDAIKRHPAGLGLGSAGGIAQNTARFDSVGAHTIDNSYLKLGYEQGIGVLALVVAGLVLLLAHLVRVAMRTPDPWAAALTAGAAGALASFAAIMLTGDYVEGLNALAAWLLAGVGAAAARAAVTARAV
jgi:hypothetical protein